MEKINEKTGTVAAYIAEVVKLAKTGKTTEHSFRGTLSVLLDALAPGLRVVNEPKREACGAPDYIVQDKNGAAVFYVETKIPGDNDLDGRKRTGNKEQFDRYKAALDTIIFTDYLDFHLYRHGEFACAVRIGDIDCDGKVKPIGGAFDALVQMVEEAAACSPKKIDSAKKLAVRMAGKARMLQRTAEQYLTPLAEEWDKNNPVGSTPGMPDAPLLSMMLDFRSMLMPGVGAAEFSDIFAQTLTYGMFAARLNDPTPETFSRMEAMALIPKSNPFLKTLFQLIATNLEDELVWIVDDLAELFAVADVSKIMKDYGKTAGMADPMVHFYEDFLREYDAGLRKERGVWYTPIQIVKFIVGAVDWVLREKFGLADGLADSSTTQTMVEEATTHGKKLSRKVAKTFHRVQILDPATGTGTFIAQAVRKVREKFDGQEGLWPGYVERDLLPRLNGFELMMASYTMAHVKLDYVLRETGVVPTGKERFRVFLTDSLSDWHKVLPGGLFAAALGREQQGADEVKRDIPVMVVMGNPPYNKSSQNNGAWIKNLVFDYKKNLNEQKINLDDDYIKFIRLAEHYVENNHSGIVAYITPHGFLGGNTHRQMRRHLMQTFDEIWTLNLHGNANSGETTPLGGKDQCVFSIKQGVSITIMVRTPSEGKHPCRVFYADLWGTRKEKLSFLDSATMESIEWQELSPAEPTYFFVPFDDATCDNAFSVEDLFLFRNSGIQTKRDRLTISTSKDCLERVINDFRSLDAEDLRTKYDLGKDGRDWSVAYAKSDIEKSSPIVSDIIYHHPFDIRYTVYTGRTKGFLAYPRKKLFRHFVGHDNIGLLVRKQTPDKPFTYVFICNTLISEGVLGIDPKGREYVFPLWLYEEHMGAVEKRANMDNAVLAKIANAIGSATVDPEMVFSYIYGVLHMPSYRAKFKELLKVDFPRIPYPKDKSQFEKVAAIGKKLIDIHLLRDAAPGLAEKRARFAAAGSDEVEEVRFEETPGSGTGCVYINPTQYFDNVPKSSWEMPIGGYCPAQKWLKDRKGCKLSVADIRHYQRIVVALEETKKQMEKLSENV